MRCVKTFKARTEKLGAVIDQLLGAGGDGTSDGIATLRVANHEFFVRFFVRFCMFFVCFCFIFFWYI